MTNRYRSIVDVYVLLRRADGCILLMERANTGYADGRLCPPSGHLEDGESVLEGAVREAAAARAARRQASRLGSLAFPCPAPPSGWRATSSASPSRPTSSATAPWNSSGARQLRHRTPRRTRRRPSAQGHRPGPRRGYRHERGPGPRPNRAPRPGGRTAHHRAELRRRALPARRHGQDRNSPRRAGRGPGARLRPAGSHDRHRRARRATRRRPAPRRDVRITGPSRRPACARASVSSLEQVQVFEALSVPACKTAGLRHGGPDFADEIVKLLAEYTRT